MLVGPAAVVGAIIRLLLPAPWAVLYRVPIAFGIAYVVAKQQARESVEAKNVLALAMIAGIGGPLLFLILGLIPCGLTALLALVFMWVGISMAADHYLDIDMETSQRITRLICVPVWLAWIIISAVVLVASGGF